MKMLHKNVWMLKARGRSGPCKCQPTSESKKEEKLYWRMKGCSEQYIKKYRCGLHVGDISALKKYFFKNKKLKKYKCWKKAVEIGIKFSFFLVPRISKLLFYERSQVPRLWQVTKPVIIRNINNIYAAD